MAILLHFDNATRYFLTWCSFFGMRLGERYSGRGTTSPASASAAPQASSLRRIGELRVVVVFRIMYCMILLEFLHSRKLRGKRIMSCMAHHKHVRIQITVIEIAVLYNRVVAIPALMTLQQPELARTLHTRSDLTNFLSMSGRTRYK